MKCLFQPYWTNHTKAIILNQSSKNIRPFPIRHNPSNTHKLSTTEVGPWQSWYRCGESRLPHSFEPSRNLSPCDPATFPSCESTLFPRVFSLGAWARCIGCILFQLFAPSDNWSCCRVCNKRTMTRYGTRCYDDFIVTVTLAAATATVNWILIVKTLEERWKPMPSFPFW